MWNSQDSLARAIGGVLWKGYDELMSTMGWTRKKGKKLPPQQIPEHLSRWEDNLAEKKKKPDELD